MTHIETELEQLKTEVKSLWQLVSSQMKKSMEALLKTDKELANEVMATEKRVNFLELKIDKDCENIFALYNPVAIDLRFVLALLKINTNLERIGDIAANVAKYVSKSTNTDYTTFVEKAHIIEMFEEACDIVDDCMEAFANQDANLARLIFKRDDLLNEMNRSAIAMIIEQAKTNPEKIELFLDILNIIRKLEKAGDRSKDIAEEIIFYIEAKVIRHKPKDLERPE